MPTDKLRVLYDKLNSANIKVPDYEVFKTKYSSEAGLDTLYSKLQKGNIKVPDVVTFKSKYYDIPTAPVVKPTTTATPKVSTAPTTTTKVSGDTTTIVSKNEPITIDIAPSTTAPTSVVNPMDVFKKFFGEGIYGAGTVGGTLFGANTERTGDKKLDRKKQNGEGAELTPGFTVPSTFEAIKSKYASDIHFELNANVDEETGIDRVTGLPIEKWSQIDSNLNKSANERLKGWNTLLENKDNTPYNGPGGQSEKITDFFKKDYADLLLSKNKLTEDYQKAIKNLDQDRLAKELEFSNLLDQKQSTSKADWEGSENEAKLDYLQKTFNYEDSGISQYKEYKKTLDANYQQKLKQQQDILNGFDASVQNVKTPEVDKIINSPEKAVAEIDSNPIKYLTDITRDIEGTQHMFQPELKAGIDNKYTKKVDGKSLFDVLANPYSDPSKGGAYANRSNNNFFISMPEIFGDYDINIIDFQKNAYTALQKNKSIAEQMAGSYEKAISEAVAYRDKTIADLQKEGKYQLDPESLKQINAQIDSYRVKLNAEKTLLTKFDKLKDNYFKDFKDWNIYTATRDKDSKTFDAITDILQPINKGVFQKIPEANKALKSMGLAVQDGLNIISKEERVSRELMMYNDNKYDKITYVPEFIKNTEAFKIHRGKDGSIKWTESLDKRAMLREGIKTTAESLVLYYTGLGIARASGLSSILSKSEFGALRYFSDKIGIIPASILEMNDIDQQEMEAYLRGDYDSINKMYSGGLRKKTIEGTTEMIWTPQANLFKNLTKQPIKQFALKQFFKQSLGKSLVSAEFQPIIKTLTENLVLVPAEESGEELAGNLLNDPFEERQEMRNLRFKATDELTMDNSIETVVNTTIGMIPTMLFGVGRGVASVKSNAAQDYNYELAVHADQYELYAIDAINKIPEEKLLKLFPQYKSKEEVIQGTKKEYTNLRESFKEVAPFSRYLIESKEKNQLFKATLELKKLLGTVDPQATEEELTKKEKKVTSLELQIDALKQKANINKKEQEENDSDYLHKNLDTLINEFATQTIDPNAIEAIKLQLEEWKDVFGTDEKYKDSVEKIDKKIEYYNTQLKNQADELEDLIQNPPSQAEEEEVVVTEVKRPESAEESIAFMKLHPNEFSLDDIELYESGATREETIIGKAQTYYDKLKETEVQVKELKNQFDEKLSTLLEIKDPTERLNSLRSYEDELARKKNGIELAKELKPHIEEAKNLIGENQVLEKTLKDVDGNVILDANGKPIVKGNFIQVDGSLKEVEDVSEDGKTIYFKTLDGNKNVVEGEERDSMPVNKVSLQITKDEAYLKQRKLDIERLTKELERLNNLPELTPEQEKSRKNVQAELEALLPKKEEEEEEEEEEEDEIPVTYEDGPVAHTPLRTIGVDMAKDLANYMANIVWKNTLLWLKNKSKSEGKKPYKDLGYYVSIVKGHLIPFSQQPDDTKTFILKKLNVKDESEIKPKEYEDLLKNTKVSVITNRKGEFLYFDKEGNPSTKSDARIATFRIPVMEKTKNNRGMYVYNKETAIKVPSQEQMDKNGITVESWNKQVEALNNLRNSDKDIQVLEINGISEGVPSIGKAVDTKISDVEKKTGELKITVKRDGTASVKINGVNSKIVRPLISEDLIEVFMKIMTEDVLPEGMDKFQTIKSLIGNFIVIGQDTFDASGKLKYKDRITYKKRLEGEVLEEGMTDFYYNGSQLSKEALREKLSNTRLNILETKYNQDGQIQIPTLVDGKIELGPFINYPKYVKDNVTIKFNEEAKKETLVSQYLTFGAPVEFEPESKKNPGRPKTNETKEEKVKNLQTEITNLTDEANELESEAVGLENKLKGLKAKQEELSSKKRKTKNDKEDLDSTNNSISDTNDALTSTMFYLGDKRDTINSKSEELAALKATKPTEEKPPISGEEEEIKIGTSNYFVVGGLIFYNSPIDGLTPIANPNKKPILDVIKAEIERRKQEELDKTEFTFLDNGKQKTIKLNSFDKTKTLDYGEVIRKGVGIREKAAEIANKFNEINAKYKEELDSLEAKPIQTPTVDIEAKKAELKYSIQQLENDLSSRVSDFVKKGASLEEAKKLAYNEFPKADRISLEKFKIELAALEGIPSTEAKTDNIKNRNRKDLFPDESEFAQVVGDSEIDLKNEIKKARLIEKNENKAKQLEAELKKRESKISSYKEVNGIGIAEYTNPKNGLVDVIMTGTSDNDYVGYVRIYQNGKPTNRWTSKMENKSQNKANIKTMLAEVQKLLPAGHEYTEKTNISLEGLKTYAQQLKYGYEILLDKYGKPVVNQIILNKASVSALQNAKSQEEIDDLYNSYENLTRAEYDEIKAKINALMPEARVLPFNETKGTINIDLPVLKSTKTVEPTTDNKTDIEAKKADIESRIVITGTDGGFEVINTSNIKNEKAGTAADVRRKYSDDRYEIEFGEGDNEKTLFTDINLGQKKDSYHYFITDKKTKKRYYVVGISSRVIGNDADRNGSLFASIEDTGNITDFTRTVLELALIKEFENQTKKRKDIFKSLPQEFINKINNKYNALTDLKSSVSTDIDTELQSKIALSGLNRGFKAISSFSFDPRNSAISNQIDAGKSFAKVTEYKGKKYIVVGLTLETQREAGERSNYSFSSIELNESTPKNIVEILENAAKNNFKNIYPDFNDQDIIKPISTKDKELAELETPQAEQTSTTETKVTQEEKELVVKIDDIIGELETSGKNSNIKDNVYGEKGKLISEGFYTLAGKLYKRVSNFLEKQINWSRNKPEQVTNLKNAVVVGNYIDLVARMFFENESVTFEQINDEIKKYPDQNKGFKNLNTENSFIDLKSKLRAIKKQLIEKHGVGTKFYSGSMFLTFDTLGLYEDKYTGIGGTMDLVVVSPKGKVYLYDFKNKITDAKENVLNKIHNSYEGKDSSAIDWTKQLSLYSEMFFQKTGIRIESISAIVFPTQYNRFGFTGKKGESFNYTEIEGTEDEKNEDFIKKVNEFSPEPTLKKDGKASLFSSEPIIYELGIDPREKPFKTNEAFNKLVIAKESGVIQPTSKDRKTKSNPDTKPKLSKLKTIPNRATKRQVEEALEWFKNSPLSKFITLNRFMDIVNSESFAEWKAGAITLFEGSNDTDLYHEAWHEFSQLYLTIDQKLALYNELRRKEGTFVTHKGKVVAYKNASNIELEELIAEDFRKYVLSGQTLILNGVPKRNSIFRTAYNFLKELLTGRVDLDTYYERLYTGNIKKYKRDTRNQLFTKAYKTAEGVFKNNYVKLSYAQQNEFFDMFDSVLPAVIKEANGSLSSIINNKESLKAAYDLMYDVFIAQLKEFDKLEKEDVEKFKSYSDIFDDLELITDETFWEQLIKNYEKESKFLSLANVRFEEDVNSKELTDKFNTNDQESEESSLSNQKDSVFNRAGNEVSSKEVANKETIFLLATLPMYLNGEIVKVKHLPSFEYAQTIPFNTAWNTVSNKVQGVKNPVKIEKLIKELGEKQKGYLEILDRVIFSSPNPLSINQLRGHIAFIQDLSKPLVRMYEVVINPEGENGMTVRTIASSTTSVTNVKQEVNNNFQDNKEVDVLKYKEKGEDNIYYLNIPKVIEDFKNIGSGEALRARFLKVLGFEYSEETLKSQDYKDLLEADNELNDPLTYIYNMLENFQKLKDDTDPKTKNLNKDSFKNVDLSKPINLLTNKYFGKSSEGKKIVILGDEKSNINKLVDIELNNSFKFSVDNATGPKGSSVWQIQDWNYITQTYEDLNDAFTYPTYQDIIKEPHLSRFNLDTNPVMDNLYLNSMFILNVPKTDPEYGKRRKDKEGNYMTIKAINYAGLKVQFKGSQSEGLNTTSLAGFDKFLQDFNSLLFNGLMEHIRYGDKSSSYGTKFDKFLYSDSSLPINIEYFGKAFFKDDKYESLPIEFTRYMKNKMANEILAMRLAQEGIGKNILNYKDKLDNWQIFDGIEGFDTLLNKIKESGMLTKEAYNNKEAILTALEQYSDEINTNLGRYFEKKYQENLSMMDSVSTPIETKVSSDLLKKYNKEQLIRAFTINNFMLNVEHVALIAGDIRMYKSALDLYKRNSAYSAPKKLSVNNSLVNKTISFLYPKLFANRIKGVIPVDEDGRLKVAIFKDHVLSSKTNIMKVLEEKLGKKYPYLGKIREIYDSMEEGDGQGWITLDAYRIFKVRQKDWSDAQELVYNKMFNKEKISDEEMAYFQPIKAQYAGQTETEYLNVPAFHKFSLVPLIPGMIEGTSLEKINNQLLKQNIGYALFASGNKASATLNSKGEHNNFYVQNKKDPNKRTPNVETYHTQTIFYDYLGEQTKIDEKPKERVTFSTQLRKLLFSNLFNQGVPTDYKGKDWENATEEDKIENSLTYRQSLKFKKTLQKLYDYYLQDLLNSIGAKYSEEKGFYEIDQTKLVALLEKEFDRRDLPQNVHKILEIDERTGKFRYPLDSSIARNTIESVLISIVDNKLRKQKITGDALIQVASSGFEEAGFTSLKTSNDLPSYIHEGRTLPDGTKVTSAMKVKIAFNKAYRPLLNLNHTDGKPIGTVKRLNEVIKNEDWLNLGVNRKLLTLVGVRIPVQGLNSQEFMEVYQFLPESAGSVIIVPTEIVAKSGGDFDIDKLSIFRPNIGLDFDESNEESVKLRKEYFTQLREEKNLEEALQDKSKIKDLQDKLQALKTKVILPLNIEKPTRTEEEIKAFYKEKIDKINKSIEKSWNIQSLKLKELFESKTLSDKNIEELFETSGDLKSTIKSLKDEIRELRNEIKGFEIGGEQEDKLISAIFKTDVNELIDQTVSEINEEIEEKEKTIQSYYGQLEEVSEKIKSLSIDKVRLKDLKEREEKRTIAQSKYTKQRKEVEKEKFQELSNSKNYLKSIENDLIDIIRESLERSDRFEELMTPNGTYLFNEFKEEKRTLTNTEMFSYKENLRQFLSNLVGKETLGIAAVHNTFYQLMQEAGMYLNNNYLPNPSNKNDKYPVRLFFSHNKTANGNISLSALTTVNSDIKISEIISQMINGYVDVAKDDWIFFVGLVKEVSSVALFMNHAGVPLNEIVAFVKNPIIKDYIKQKINSKSLFYKNATKDTIKNPTDYIRRTLFKKLGVSTDYVDKNLSVNPLSIKKITKKVLEGFEGTNILDNNQEGITENKKQAQILAHFIELEELSSNLTELMGSLNADTNKAKSIYFAEETFRKLRTVKLKNLFPIDKIISIEKNSSISSFVNIENGVKRVITNLWKQVFTVGDARTLNTFLYDKLTNDFNIKGDLRGKNKEKLLKTFKNDLFQYIFQNYVFKPNSTQLISKSIKPLLDNKSDKSIRVLITDFRDKFPEIAKTNSLIEKLTYSISNNKEVGTNLVNPKLNTGKLDVSLSNELTEAFEKLLNDTNPEVVQFAKILAYVGFMQSGLNKSNISYTTIIPNEAYSPLMKDPILKFGEYLQKEESVKTLENFYRLFRRNNPNFFIGEQSFPNKEPYRFKDYEDLKKFDIFADMSNLPAAPIVKPKEEEEETPIGDNIYDILGKDTQSKNVILPKDVDPEADDVGMKYTTAIDFWREIVPEAMDLYNKARPLIVAFRGNSKKTFLQNYNSGTHTIGNPFDFRDEAGNRKDQGVLSTKKFIEWMITGNNFGNSNATEEYRQAIIKDIKSGKLKNGSILYYQEKGYATHATALDYLINEYNWSQPPTTQILNNVEITKSNYTRKEVQNNPDIAYVFTENTHSITAFPNTQGGGSAIIRPEPNAFAIVTKKKYDYNTKENVDYTDTEANFKEFTEINTKLIKEIKNSGKSKIVFPQGFATDKAKMPTRFAEWLQETLLDNFGLVTELNSTKTGLISKSITQSSTTEVVPTVSVENTFKTKIDQFTYTLNTTTGEVIHNSKTGDRLETNETQIGKVYKEYALANNYETKEFNKQNYAKVFDKVVNINNGSIVTMPNIVLLFNKGTENLKNIVKSGAIVLNTGQKEALAKFTEFLDKGKNKNFLLKGRAGTGKTTIASTMMKVAKEKGYRIFATAISDAATTNLSVLSKNTPDSNIEIYNFAAMYGLVPQYDDDGNMTGFDFPSENSQTESAPKISNSDKTILIFDEASMVSQETLSKIQKLTPDITILYMGDNAQIMPIGDTKISTVFALEDQHELTEVMRQKEDSPILNIASNIAREIDVYDSTGELKLSPILDNVYTDFNESKNSGSIVTNSKETFINEAVEDFKKYGNKQTLVITGNNDNVESLNKKIREKIVNSDEQFIIGERLMTYTKYSKFMGKNKPKIEIFNSSVVTILSVSPSNVDGVPTNELLVEYTDQKGEIKQTYMNVIHRSNIQDKNKFYANRKKLDAEYKKTRDRSILDKLNPYRQTVLVDYAYAMTAHKAQGQTVRNTYVLPVYRGFSNLEARRMFYTSITRPTDKLVIFDQKANESNTTNNFSDQPLNISSEELGLNTNVSQEDAKCNS